jgi:EAL domain-containing protein (putative c-di-GMP-specific phosphodiesterase class I)
MASSQTLIAADNKPDRSANPLCFIVEEDFVFRQGLARELQQLGVDIVGLSESSRLTDMVDDQNPDIVLINLDRTAPHECVRALSALKDCRYSGAVQLFGQCEPRLLESLSILGDDYSLTMLAPLQKPIKVATIHNIILGRKQNAAPAPASGIPLAEALKKDLVKFLYQPQFDLKTKLMIGLEAVARVAHPELGLLTPDRFLKGADEDARVALSRLALLKAMKASARFHEQGIALSVSININVDDLLKIPVPDIVMLHRPEDSRWAGVILEMPERQVANRIDLLKARSHKLKQAGVSIAIDNFGLNSTCLAMMNKIDFAEIKIDRVLVEDCATNAGNMKICKTLIQMAHNFGSRAVAVGIGKKEDLRTLAELGCDVGQGFLLGKPMKRQQIDDMIAGYKSASEKSTNSAVATLAVPA